MSGTHKTDYGIAAKKYQKLLTDYGLFVENNLVPIIKELSEASGIISIAYEPLPAF